MPESPSEDLSFRIEGLDCAAEVALLKGAVGPLVGGEENLAFDVVRGRMTVLDRAPSVTRQELERAVSRTGMRAEPWRYDSGPDAVSAAAMGGAWSRHGRAVLCLTSALFLALALGAQVSIQGGWVAVAQGGEGAASGVPVPAAVLYLIAIVAGAWYVVPKALYAARALRPDMNLLMMVAVGGAVTIGEWFEAASVSCLFALALLLERWSVGRARRAIESLLDLSPAMARVVAEGTEEVRECPPEEVPVGALVRVRPGEKIPLDGELTRGSTSVDQSPITGESEPAAKTPGDLVYAGTVNGEGAFELRVTRGAYDSTLARIVRMVEEAQARRAPSERWVDRFARVYTPLMMALALAVAVLPPILLGVAWTPWLYRALVLLVIACPCALVISTPVAVVAGLASAARVGVLIKGGSFLEAPTHFRAMAFDKTGTLTHGKPQVRQVLPLNGHSEDDLLARAAALELESNHPVAQGVLSEARRRGLAIAAAESLTNLPGRGLEGRINGRPFWVGSHRMMEEKGGETPRCHDLALEIEASGQTLLAVGNDEHVCGLIAVADQVRPEATQALQALKDLGIHRLVMLTGDHERTARTVADTLGVEDVRAGLLPEEKVEAVAQLQAELGAVAMVGDGINDAPALAAASTGIAMGTAGSDAAIETADIALMSDDLGHLPWLIGHSRRARRIVRQNIAFALTVKAGFITLAAFNLATLWMAIAADMGASLLVIANALRLLAIRRSNRPTGIHSSDSKPSHGPSPDGGG